MRAAGAAFEQRACAELQRAGLKLLARNYTTRHGELDLVMMDRDTVVFVEVRHRLHSSRGDAAASVNAGKQSKLIKTAGLWLAAHSQHANRACRFDVVCYDGPTEAPHELVAQRAFEAN